MTVPNASADPFDTQRAEGSSESENPAEGMREALLREERRRRSLDALAALKGRARTTRVTASSRPLPGETRVREALSGRALPRNERVPTPGASPATPTISVTEALERCRGAVEGLLDGLWIEGEVSETHRSAAGHTYFRLKDATGLLSCVYFARAARSAPADFEPGDRIEIRGSADIYVKGGDLQLRVVEWRPAGEGALYEAFLRLKAKLEAEGLFAEGRKKTLPVFVRRIAVVTSPQAAALQDVLRTLARRTPWIRVCLSEALVQGAGSPASLVAALRRADEAGADVVLLVRGGGSLEDLTSFNDEEVARAVAAMRTPVVTGVGHETDVTIADFAADRRASTPTAAAECVSPDLAHWLMRLERSEEGLARALDRTLGEASVRLDRAERHFPDALRVLRHAEGRLADAVRRRDALFASYLRSLRQRLEGAGRRLASPEAALAAPMARLSRAEERLNANARLRLDAAEEASRRASLRLESAADGRLASADLRLRRAARWMPDAERFLLPVRQRLDALERTLSALDPDRPLRVGYLRLESPLGLPLLASDLRTGESVRLRFAEGTADARIEALYPEPIPLSPDAHD